MYPRNNAGYTHVSTNGYLPRNNSGCYHVCKLYIRMPPINKTGYTVVCTYGCRDIVYHCV